MSDKEDAMEQGGSYTAIRRPWWRSGYCATRPKVHGFKPSRSAENDGFLMATKISRTTFIGEPLAPCRKILHVKYPYSMKEISVGKIYGHSSPCFSCFFAKCLCSLLPQSSGGYINKKINPWRYSSDEPWAG
jgi:hypothetical protein